MIQIISVGPEGRSLAVPDRVSPEVCDPATLAPDAVTPRSRGVVF